LNNLRIRKAVESDVQQISVLIQSVMHLFFSEAGGSGADRFIASIKPDALKAFIRRPDVDYYIGFVDDTFCGAVGVRDSRDVRGGKHLQHLFVVPSLHRKGLGKALWQYVEDAANAEHFTVNASINAVPFYAKLGFTNVGEIQQSNGIIFQAMKLNLEKQVMSRQLISSGSRFEAQMGYSRAVVVEPWVFVSGTTGFDYSNMTISDDVVQQTEQCFLNIQEALMRAQSNLNEVVRVTYILPVAADFEKCWPVLQKYFGDVRPAATMISAGVADARIKIEIEVTAMRGSAKV
jgi:enamine deaminase RidA (YjgF/YER057c/UK114 family)/ribosomal protein S18 acetylase RimI-like enzyme